ncbi:MAG: hypothetical protein ACREI2_07055 [Nitrospiraceae bacterium]
MKPHRHVRLRCIFAALFVTVAPLAFISCVATTQPHPVTAQQTLIGKSESEVLACAGPPRKASLHNGGRLLTYYKEGGTLEQSFPGSKGSRPEGIRHSCTAIVTVENDLVTKVEYRMMPESSSTHKHCEEIFQSCGP